ncbi:putative sugar nucleotidyl transferase [Rubripirellula reticaptiva]|uniref:Bifunctional protein GlmU n=1 Tax=Rubripirellula reticaptiva TaxID=2528013 RepID=A0A5C6F1V9_9BACT|nr:putative sugar nucleotidyl transferase [Rubripirellula reticaptiva]TWU55075.1 Bifunctional protein GlmU [Rubripirellula reticaptiva]
MQIICFEDDRVDQLRPIAIARPAYAITSASFCLVDWLKRLPGKLTGSVRPYLQVIQQLDHGIDRVPDTIDDADGVLLVNARVMPTVEQEKTLGELVKLGRSGIVVDGEDGSILAARMTAADVASVDADETYSLIERLLAKAGQLDRLEHKLAAFCWPHDIIACHMKEMATSMNRRLELGRYTETSDGVFVGQGVQIGQYAAVDTSAGPIIFEDNVKVGPFCYLSGPVHAGAGTRVIEHSALKDGVSLGHTTKIGGEVEASVIEPYTNKQHHGFLGHSYLGSWINLGAGTCNSDLKNTYGKINITYGDRKTATGMQFLGCFVGDYSKTAINTSIFTGKVIGVCSMMYGFVTSNVPSYVNYARLFGQTSLLPADVMINTQKRMFSRRKVEQRDCDKQLIRDMYDLTADERSADPDIL